MRPRNSCAVFFVVLLTAACDEPEVVAPAPMELTSDAIGYYCNMTVVDHPGPKGQIFVKGTKEPLWFSSVRDAVAFTMLPGEPKQLSAIYVHDAGKMSRWQAPDDSAWIEATGAHYVIGSQMTGGMGLPEAVPFADAAAAKAFAAKHGGHVMGWKAIPRDYIINSGEADGDGETKGMHDGHGTAQGDSHKMPQQPPQAQHGGGHKDG